MGFSFCLKLPIFQFHLAAKTWAFMREKGLIYRVTYLNQTLLLFVCYSPFLHFISPLLHFEGRPLIMAKKVLERDFQAKLVKDLQKLFPGCLVLKQDSGYKQGIPDLLILFQNKWASLECKRSENASKRPNQQYYVDLLDKMSFARFINPENKEKVLNELQQTFKA